MLDTVLKIFALATFIVSIAFIPIFVPDLDLIVVCAIVAAMATYDFLIYPTRRNRRRS